MSNLPPKCNIDNTRHSPLKHDSEQLDDDQHNYILSCGLLEHFTPL